MRIPQRRLFYTLVFIPSSLAAMIGVRGGQVGISCVKPPGNEVTSGGIGSLRLPVSLLLYQHNAPPAVEFVGRGHCLGLVAGSSTVKSHTACQYLILSIGNLHVYDILAPKSKAFYWCVTGGWLEYYWPCARQRTGVCLLLFVMSMYSY